MTPSAPAPRPPLRRPLAVLAAAALTAAVVPALQAGPVSAAPAAPVAASSSLTTPDAPPTGRAWIEGQVVDQASRPLDGVLVQAYDAAAVEEDPDVAPVASWLTYADPADGPAHGFYRLYVPRSPDGVYEIRFSSPEGAEDPYRTRTLDGAIYVGGNKRSPGRVVDAGTTRMTLVRQATATVELDPDRDATKRRASELEVEVTSPDVDPVTGRVTLRLDGRPHGQQRLSGGDADLKLPALKPGRHTVVVAYEGSDLVAPATGRTTIKVEKPPKKDAKGKGKKDDKGGKGKGGGGRR